MNSSNQTLMITVRNAGKAEDQSVYWDGMAAYTARFVSDFKLAEIYTYLGKIPAPLRVKDIPLKVN